MSDETTGFDPVEEIVEAFLERHRRGERPSLSEYVDRYPECAERIRALFPALMLMEDLGSRGGDATGTQAGHDGLQAPVPQRLGDYLLLRPIGSGGMGVVYEAIQESLGRHVALKTLPFHQLSDPTRLERFRREARTAARLHHTHIVPVFGVGEHDGLHYYAMQFIRGHGLDAILNEVKRLRGAPNEAGAVAPPDQDLPATLAHSLHSGQFGGNGMGKDDGLATGAPQAHPGAAPEASGEQSELSSQPEAQYQKSVARIGIDVADALEYAHNQGILHRDIKPANLMLDAQGQVWITDFGLAKAHDSVELTRTGDIVGALRYMAPERFSGWSDRRSDVYALGATLYELLMLRPAFEESDRAKLIQRVLHESPAPLRRLERRIPRDLETIVLKALAKEPGERYATAGQLAEDLRRFVAGRPILSRPAGPIERLGRWCKRNPWIAGMTGVAAAAAMVSVVALGAVVVLQQRANRALQSSNLKLVAANNREQSARQLAQTRYALAKKTVEAYYKGASEDVLLKQPELEDLRKRLLQTALQFYREMATTFAEGPDNTAATREELAEAYFVVAGITEQVGSKEDALAAVQTVRAVLEDLLHAKPGDEALRGRLADCLQFLAYLCSSTGRRADAARAYREGLVLREALLKERPDDTILLRETAGILQRIGNFQQEDGHREDALRSYRQALIYHDEVARLRPDDVVNQSKRAGVLRDLGLLQGRTNREEGVRTLEKAMGVHRRIVRDHPNDDEYLKSLAASCNDLAGHCWQLERYDEALRRYHEALALYEDLARRHPTISELRNQIASGHYDIGLVHSSKNRLDQALQSFRTALPIREALVQAHPTVVDYQLTLSKIYFQLGYLHRRLGHSDEAVSWYGKALPLQEAAHQAQPDLTAATENLAWTYNNLGYLQQLKGRLSEAIKSYDRAVHYRRQLVERDPAAIRWREDLQHSYLNLGVSKRDVGDTAGALEAIKEEVAILESLIRHHAGDRNLEQQLAEGRSFRAELLLLSGRSSESLELARHAAGHNEDVYRADPSVERARSNLGYSCLVLGNAQLACGDPVAAQHSYNRSRSLLESLNRPDPMNLAVLGRTYSLLGACPAPGGPPSTPEGQAARQAFADRAMANLRDAFRGGWRDWGWCRREPDLNALRARDDFQMLMSDMVFPDDPFAH